MKKLTWNVYNHNVNLDQIEIINIFDYSCMKEFLNKYKKTNSTKEEFAKDLDSELRYYFWSKSQSEFIIKAWIGGKAEKKVDIYNQIHMNWDVFVDYCWTRINE